MIHKKCNGCGRKELVVRQWVNHPNHKNNGMLTCRNCLMKFALSLTKKLPEENTIVELQNVKVGRVVAV